MSKMDAIQKLDVKKLVKSYPREYYSGGENVEYMRRKINPTKSLGESESSVEIENKVEEKLNC